MKVAAIHLDSTFLDITSNEEKAKTYIQEAKEEGSELVILPEFFDTGFAYSKELVKQVVKRTTEKEKMREWARTYEIIVGGSYLEFDGEEIRNTFGLFFPSGEEYFHSKDIPTLIEQYAYTKGDTQSVFETPIGRIGVALCWEQIRYDTVRRMAGKIDLCLAGSCWWGFSKADPIYLQRLEQANKDMAEQAPVTLARLLGVPVIHASHHASFTGDILTRPMEKETRTIYGATQIVDANGTVVARLGYEENGGIITCNVEPKAGNGLAIDEAAYWIPPMPEEFLRMWESVNKSCHSYYEMETKKIWNRSCNFSTP